MPLRPLCGRRGARPRCKSSTPVAASGSGRDDLVIRQSGNRRPHTMHLLDQCSHTEEEREYTDDSAEKWNAAQ